MKSPNRGAAGRARGDSRPTKLSVDSRSSSSSSAANRFAVGDSRRLAPPPARRGRGVGPLRRPSPARAGNPRRSLARRQSRKLFAPRHHGSLMVAPQILLANDETAFLYGEDLVCRVLFLSNALNGVFRVHLILLLFNIKRRYGLCALRLLLLEICVLYAKRRCMSPLFCAVNMSCWKTVCLNGPSSWLELLGAGLIFQAIGFGWLFFLLLQEWRDKRRGLMMRSSSVPSGDQ